VIAVVLRVRLQYAKKTDNVADSGKEKLTGRDDGNDSAIRLDSGI